MTEHANDNSLTFFILNYVKDPKQFGVDIPSFKYKVRVKKVQLL
jgi:hypothetical protein